MIATSTSDPAGKVHLATSLDGLGNRFFRIRGYDRRAREPAAEGWPSAKNWPGSILTMHITADSWPFLTTTSGLSLVEAGEPCFPLWRTTEQNSIYLNRWAPPIQKTFKRDGTGRLRINRLVMFQSARLMCVELSHSTVPTPGARS